MLVGRLGTRVDDLFPEEESVKEEIAGEQQRVVDLGKLLFLLLFIYTC